MSNAQKHHFQAEIQQVLDIVIHSLYTDREVFVRELISNASDACERLRFQQASGAKEIHQPEVGQTISVKTDETAKALTITDTGIGMTRDELVENLGTIAHSGTKAFLKQLAEKQKPDVGLIGQFGVGFYSAFMAAKKVTVLSRSCQPGETGWQRVSEGAGGYELDAAADLPRGTQIILELKDECVDFAKPFQVEGIIKRYSNFVQCPIELNGTRVNTVQAIWARNKAEVKDEEYNEFYRYIGHDTDAPLGRLHFVTDAPLSIQSVLFIPARNFELLSMTREESQVHLYCRKVLIESRAKGLLPEWLRFLRGVVDSEDLPLNISRERMQDSTLLQKLNRALTSRFLKFLEEQAEKDPAMFDKFQEQYGRFLKEGVLSDSDHRSALAKLLRFDSTVQEKEAKTSLADYVKRMAADQNEIYYLYAPNRAAAESSPYFEVFRAKKLEVLFVYEPLDEFVLDRLYDFDGKQLVSAEKAAVTLPTPESKEGTLTEDQTKTLAAWLKEKLGTQVGEVRASQRLVESPAVVLDHDKFMTATMRQVLRHTNRGGEAPPVGSYDFEINPRHPVLVRLHAMHETDAPLAAQVAEQLLDNARMAAGLLDDPRRMIQRLNELLEKVLGNKPD